MIETLKQFTAGISLFDATSGLLAKLHIKFDRETAEPIHLADLYDGPMPQTVKTIVDDKIASSYFIGVVNSQSLAGTKSDASLEEIAETIEQGGKYDGMFVFACDAKPDANLTRTEASTLTRALNRIARANPVVLVLRQGHLLSLSTCERMDYTQAWRQGTGEKLGKVCILRNIDCAHPHRGHVDILQSLGDKTFTSFDDLYKHWMDTFSNELLTKKFYNELSDWYAWAVQVVKFPNDLHTTDDDAKYNSEACIRLITRLIFVWFLKQKHLVPEEFFDEDYIRENLIDNFNPHDKQNLLYNSEESKYYRLILQNLFFAMLNCPIVAEGKTTPNNRRFRGDGQKGYKRDGYNVNNLMRYKSEFAPNGSDTFLQLANQNVPFLNGGLFDCLDKKENGLYYDGFSERKESLEQLFFPDYLFFGEEIGKGIDLSQWYDDKKKKNVSARGIIDILKRYSFTIEENTPFDQEVSLDPELLGKVFENLLAAYNPETKKTARKQTGSFYTPREIVQYMVDESLVAHLKRTCGDADETKYRALLSYASGEVVLSEDEPERIMKAIYNCRVLDPACGSGAFPMGVLQQMVHILKRIDPTNEMWNSMMVDIAIQDAKTELEKATSGSAAEREKIEENRKARLDDIESAFNRSINDPDYARKLYLIEHCIYGVDIQPIATQISKLRFFISLVVDQKPTKEATTNFGIRPLPNLEAKFVSANTLIPVAYGGNVVDSAPKVVECKEKLKELNHKIFLSRRNSEKNALKKEIKETRQHLAEAIQEIGLASEGVAQQLADWDMFDQNASSSFFDPEWMFGVKEGFDIVIGNPPYVLISKKVFNELYSKSYKYQEGKIDLYRLFIEKGIYLCSASGVLTYITPNTFLSIINCAKLRKFLLQSASFSFINNYDESIFEASVNSVVFLLNKSTSETIIPVRLHSNNGIKHIELNVSLIVDFKYCVININADNSAYDLKGKMLANSTLLGNIKGIEMCLGVQPYHNTIHTKEQMKSKFLHSDYQKSDNYVRDYGGKHFSKYILDKQSEKWVDYSAEFYTKPDARFFNGARIVVREIPSDTLICAYLEEFALFNKSVFNIRCNNDEVNLKYITAVLNSKAIGFFISAFGDKSKQTLFPRVSMKILKQLPIPNAQHNEISRISRIVDKIIEKKKKGQETSNLENEINYIVYKLFSLSYDDIKLVDATTCITRQEYESLNLS